MIRCTCTIVGISPFSFSAPLQSKRGDKGEETYEQFEDRVWREHIHQDKNGNAFIPPTALKNCLAEAAKYKSETIPGNKRQTYTKKFESGISVIEPLMLGVKAADIDNERLFLPSDGKRGSGSRVWKRYPYLPEWKATAEIMILDTIISPEKLLEYLELAGKFIGMGRFRPSRNGYYGRFTVENFKHDRAIAA